MRNARRVSVRGLRIIIVVVVPLSPPSTSRRRRRRERVPSRKIRDSEDRSRKFQK